MTAKTYAEDIKTLIEDRLRLKSRSLSHAIRRAGRLLPAWARREARFIAQAETMMAHPKLRVRVDEAKLARAHADLTNYLRTIDPKERRKTRVLGILGTVSFNLIVIVAAFVTYLVWRGFV
ncbi:hypothetical protein [Pseudooctadecabacter jejudonensis]|uniref:Uncharacterized protein n=1 Tax=Pseudooctadecabacter jejudonensis TaxID=1391910 RepID=A0A1Y5SKE2_9RHOB|nr:hypothetical protein [Pseudooctadecabacter jejudonensis]SLN42830.1 hypothetical protein PSJ8397_02177 [Pseudooctadecabacter jejudonensis]